MLVAAVGAEPSAPDLRPPPLDRGSVFLVSFGSFSTELREPTAPPRLQVSEGRHNLRAGKHDAAVQMIDISIVRVRQPNPRPAAGGRRSHRRSRAQPCPPADRYCAGRPRPAAPSRP